MAKRVGAKTWSAQSNSKAKSKSKTQYQYKKIRREKWRERLGRVDSADDLDPIR